MGLLDFIRAHRSTHSTTVSAILFSTRQELRTWSSSLCCELYWERSSSWALPVRWNWLLTPHSCASNSDIPASPLPSSPPIAFLGPREKLLPFSSPLPFTSFHLPSSPTHSPFTDPPLFLLLEIRTSIMHQLVNLAVQRGRTWNPVERAVWTYISDGDNGKLNAHLSDCPHPLLCDPSPLWYY